MTKRGITKDIIITAATELIEKYGLAEFSIRQLANRLGVRASSLYNHISGQKEILETVGLRAVSMLTARENEAIAGKNGDDALFELACAYRKFAHENCELYRIIMKVHTLKLPSLENAAESISEPILKVISDYGVEGERAIHYLRMLRSLMHGFFAHEQSGSFKHSEIDREESYQMAISQVAACLSAERGGKAI